MPELFIYFRAAVSDAAAVQQAVAAFQHSLRARHPGLGARLLRRPEAGNGQHTWMEIYTLPAQASADTALIQADIEHAAAVLSGWIVGERHVEVFLPCA